MFLCISMDFISRNGWYIFELVYVCECAMPHIFMQLALDHDDQDDDGDNNDASNSPFTVSSMYSVGIYGTACRHNDPRLLLFLLALFLLAAWKEKKTTKTKNRLFVRSIACLYTINVYNVVCACVCVCIYLCVYSYYINLIYGLKKLCLTYLCVCC